MWKQLGQLLDLDPPTAIDGGVYLGCAQRNTPLNQELLMNKLSVYDAVKQRDVALAPQYGPGKAPPSLLETFDVKDQGGSGG